MKRIMRIREDAGETTELIAERPPEAAYGKYIHCGFCSTVYEAANLNLHPQETHVQCTICGNLISLYTDDLHGALRAQHQPSRVDRATV